MNATELIVALFLSAGCYTLDVADTKVSGQSYRTATYRCLTHTFQTWQQWCPVGRGFYGRVFLIKEINTGEGFYLNRFGEVMGGIQVDVNEIYKPTCGA